MSDYYYLWVTPDEAEYVPSQEVLDGLIDDLAKAGWIKTPGETPPLDVQRLPCHAIFQSALDGGAPAGDPRFDMSEVPVSEPTLYSSHFKSLFLLVSDHLRLAPTADTAEIEKLCNSCGAELLDSSIDFDEDQAEDEDGRAFPLACPDCGDDLDLTEYGHLPLFRFALQLEPWHPSARDGLRIDPELLSLLQRRTGVAFDAAGQYPF